MTADVLSSHGLVNTEVIVAAAADVGVPLWLAAALIEKESGGRNVYGNDRDGVFSRPDPARPPGGEVTPENYLEFERRVLAGETSNGVGLAQITWPGFIRDARTRGIPLWVPLDNVRYGLQLLAGYLAGATHDEAIREAGRRYNGAIAYGDDLVARATTWRDRLDRAGETPMTVVATTQMNWTVTNPQNFTASRPGPHTPTGGNGREIWFRNAATADLLAATMWLIHTGCAGQLPDIPVYLWHGARALDADFGSDNSDHKAGVAMDTNWPEHPWEVALADTNAARKAAYDRHMAETRHANAHAVFRAVQRKMTPPGARTLVRWCGEPWKAPDGDGYWSPLRDCMHWVIEAPDWTRINAARDWLHTWFVPPRTKEDVGAWQDRIDAVRDNQWGPGSVKAMRVLQKALGVPRTGLPGDVATWRAYKALFHATTGPDYSSFLPRDIKAAQGLLKQASWYPGDLDGLPGPQFRDGMYKAMLELKRLGLYKGEIDRLPGPGFTTAITAYLKRPIGAPTPPAPAPAPPPAPKPTLAEVVAPHRLAGADRYATAALLAARPAEAGTVYLAASGTDDAAAAPGRVLLARPGVAILPDPTRTALAAIRPTQLVIVGGPASIPDTQAHAALLAAGLIKE